MKRKIDNIIINSNALIKEMNSSQSSSYNYLDTIRSGWIPRNQKGFTLMEIMVVVVIIAVLASVAGPMIGDLVNQGKSSATRSKMSSLKSAIIAYKNDVGRYPYQGNKDDKMTADKYSVASGTEYVSNVMGDNYELNVLVNVTCDIKSSTPANTSKQYGKDNRRWKGPYMDSDPNEFMFDSWGNKINYLACGHGLYLWSYGADGLSGLTGAQTLASISTKVASEDSEDDENDDIVVSIARFKSAFTSTGGGGS